MGPAIHNSPIISNLATVQASVPLSGQINVVGPNKINSSATFAASGQFEAVFTPAKANPIYIEYWSAEKNIRFKELANKEVLDTISNEESKELDTLIRLRRSEKYPRSADEILWQRRQQKTTRKLVEILREYVELHETQNYP